MNFGRDEIFSPAWRSSLGAVSVGVQSAGSAATVTRQIVGVAAGTQDTDAVNVAQLKKLDTKVEKHRVHYFAVSTTDTDNDGNTNALGTDSMAIGPSARANLNRSLAIGKSAGAYVDGGIALGSDSYNIVTSGMRGYIPTSVSLTEEEQTTPTWRATLGALAIGVSAVDSTGAVTTATQTRQIVGVAAGTQDTDAVNVAQLKALGSTVDANKISFVSINEKSRGDNDNKDNDGATGDDAIAIGVFASATAPNATAMGQKAKATNYNSIALGDFANASGIGSTAVGDYAIASSHSTVAVGSDANATGLESIAIGHTAKGTGYQATAVGSEAAASGIDSLAAGFGSSAKGQFGSAFGSAATTDGDFATAAGYGAKATANSSTALGENATANIAGGVALGSYSKTNVNSGVLGYDPSDKITTQEILLGDNKDTYDNLQTEITTAQTNVSSLAQQILDLQTEYDTADDARRAEIVNEIKSLNKQFLAARADLQDKVSAANKLVSTWQATGAAVSVGDSETGLTRQITNVAAGTEDTDAVNVAQLSALNDKVDEGWTLAVARGSDSKTENDATVEGDSKQINVGDTVTLQAGRGIKLKQDEAAVQIGLKYLDVEPKGDTYNDAAASGEGALAIGQNSVASGQQGTAVGYAAQATGKSSFAGGTNAIAGGGNSIAIGTNAITSVQESIAIGKGKGNDTDGYKKVDSGFSVAIGSSSVALGGSSQVTNSSSATALGGKAKVTDSVNGTAIGASAAVSGSRNGTAIGKNAKVENAEDAVALGSQSVANRAKGTVGYDVTGTDHSNDATGTWKSVLGAVSVGKTDNTRQITNVAAGSEDSDAVNVAQLKAAGTAGLNFKGDGDTVVHRDLGATLNVVGGNTDATALTEGNIGVVADSDAGTLSVKLAKNLALGDGSITFAPTGAKDADGNTLVQGQDGKWYSDLTDATYDATNNVYTKADGTTVSAVENPVVSSVKLTNTGLDNGGNKITNVAAGTVDTDIVNLGQLKGSQIKASDVTYADNGSGTITLTMQDDSKVTIDSLKDIYVKEGKLENNTLTFTRNDNTSFEVGDIASKTDMDSAVSNANLKFTGDNTAEAATLTKKNGETLNILGGATEFTTANNIGIVADTDKGTLNVKLAKNVSMGDGSITFAPNAKDAEGNALVQGQDGKWYSDLTDATYDATNNVYTKADGTTVSAVENPVVSAVTLTNTGLDNGGNKITNVAAGTEDTDIVNLKQLKGSTIKSSELKYTDAGVGTMTLTMQDGSKFEIGGLQDKYIKDASLDGNKLTITRNDDKKFEVDNIATTADIIGENSKVNLKFTGDDTSESATITKKNAETLTIYGGVAATDADGNSLLSDVNNVGVVKTDDGLQIKLAKDLSGIDSARIGGTVADGAATGGIYIANQSVTYNGSAKKTESGLYITGLANTKWNPTTDGIVSGRAATEDQLKAAYDGLSTTITANKIVAGDNITVTPLEDGSGTKVSLSDNLAFGDKNGKNIAINGKDGIISAGDGKDNQVVVDGANSTVTAGTGANQVTVDGTKAGITAGKGANQVAIDGTKGQVTIGEAGKGLVMGNQDVAVKNADGTDKADENGNAVKDSGKYITGLDNTTWKPEENGYVPNRAATEGQLKDVVGQVDTKIDGINKDIETINNAKRGFNSDTGEKIERGKDDVLDIKGGAKGELSEGNIGVVNNTGATGFDVKLAKDLKGLNSVTSNTVTTKELTVSEKANIGNVSISNDNVTIGTGDSKTVITNESVTTGSVTTGNTTINNDGLTVKNEDSLKNITVQNNNVSMGGNVVHNVADGVEATDAINKGQFDRTVNAIGTGMNQMSNRISKLDTRVDRVGAGAAALAALHPLEYNADEKWEISAGVGNYRGANAVAVGAFYRPNGNTLVSLGTSYGGGENMVNAGVTWRVGEGETGNYSSKQAMAQEISSLKSVVSDQSSQLQAQNSKIEAQSQQLEEQNKKIEQLMQAIAELKK